MTKQCGKPGSLSACREGAREWKMDLSDLVVVVVVVVRGGGGSAAVVSHPAIKSGMDHSFPHQNHSIICFNLGVFSSENQRARGTTRQS